MGRTVRICGQGQALVRSSTQPSSPLRAARGNVGDVISGMVNRSSSWAILDDVDLGDIYYSIDYHPVDLDDIYYSIDYHPVSSHTYYT